MWSSLLFRPPGLFLWSNFTQISLKAVLAPTDSKGVTLLQYPLSFCPFSYLPHHRVLARISPAASLFLSSQRKSHSVRVSPLMIPSVLLPQAWLGFIELRRHGPKIRLTSFLWAMVIAWATVSSCLFTQTSSSIRKREEDLMTSRVWAKSSKIKHPWREMFDSACKIIPLHSSRHST